MFRRPMTYAIVAIALAMGAALDMKRNLANAQESYLGQIQMFGFNFAPRGWAFCDGQLLPIAQNTALFSLLGTIYGGDGRTTFGLPDLRGRVPVHLGQGPGLANFTIGQKGGFATTTLSVQQMPLHAHAAQTTVHAGSATSDSGDPEDNLWGASALIPGQGGGR